MAQGSFSLEAFIFVFADTTAIGSSVFLFSNGFSNEANAARAAVHAGADILTLGLWEVIGTPSEALLQGNIEVVKVFYDSQSVFGKVSYYSNKSKIN